MPEYPCGGGEVHGVLGRQPGLARLAAYADPDFRAEAYLPAGGPPLSVAAAAGLS